MFATPAFAQTAGAAPNATLQLMQGLPFLLMMGVLFFFLIIRPQQQRMKQHQAMIANLKRGDQVVLNDGMIGKIVRIEDKEAGVEIATGVTVKVVKSMIGEVRVRGEPAPANDAKN